jgi:hypothetical protein
MFDNSVRVIRPSKGETTMAQRNQRGWLKKEKGAQGETWVLFFRTTRRPDGRRVEQKIAIVRRKQPSQWFEHSYMSNSILNADHPGRDPDREDLCSPKSRIRVDFVQAAPVEGAYFGFGQNMSQNPYARKPNAKARIKGPPPALR